MQEQCVESGFIGFLNHAVDGGGQERRRGMTEDHQPLHRSAGGGSVFGGVGEEAPIRGINLSPHLNPGRFGLSFDVGTIRPLPHERVAPGPLVTVPFHRCR